MLNHLTKSISQSQQEFLHLKKDGRKYEPLIWNTLDPQPNKDYALGYIYALRPSEKRVLNTILTLCSRYKFVYAAQKGAIARMSKVHYKTALKALHKLERLGFIAIQGMGYHKPCNYKVSSWFKNNTTQGLLKKVLPIFFYSVVNLFSLPFQEPISKSTPLSTSVFNFIKNTAAPSYFPKVKTAALGKIFQQKAVQNVSLCNAPPPIPINLEEIARKIADREKIFIALAAAFEKSGHWKTGEMLEKVKKELVELKEQYAGANSKSAESK